VKALQWLRVIFPPPLKPLRWQRLLSPVLFFALYFGGIAALQLLDVMLFTRPIAFVLLLIVGPWIWWMSLAGGGALTGWRGPAALWVRFILVGALVMLLAEPRAVRTNEALSLMYVVDMSDSIGKETTDAAMGYVLSTRENKPARDKAGLVVFGKDSAVELPPRDAFSVDNDQALNAQVSRDGTNLQKALTQAAAMLPEDNQGRLVLISDGTQTDGNLTRAIDELIARRIAVDVLPVQYEHSNEVWLERLELPRSVKRGESYDAAVILSSLSDGVGQLVLLENGRRIFSEEVNYKSGKNRFTIPIRLREAGFYEYQAVLEPAANTDGWSRNNIAISSLYLQGEGRVLLVTDPNGDARDWRDLAQALDDSRKLVDQQTAYEFPRDPMALLPYDAVIFCNVPADAFDRQQMQVMRDAVHNLGVGFLMVGGPASFGPGGYNRTAIEEALPVTMDVSQKKVMPKGALAIILHTCEFPEGNTWAKRITKEAIQVLGKQDEAGVLAFDWQGGDAWLFKLTPVAQYEAVMVPAINNAQIGDMPDFGGTMQMALDGLTASNASSKHLILISDGDPQPPNGAMLQKYVDNKITITTISIFPHGGQEVQVMANIAQLTGGRYYSPQDAKMLPRIFMKEAKTLKRSMIQEVDFTPKLEYPSPIMKGIETMPQLHGYVLTTPKAFPAQTILEGPEEEDLDPVLVVWSFGVGKSAAFTSDLSPRWGKDWITWEQYRAFVDQLLVHVSRVQQDTKLQVQSFAAGDTGVIIVDDFADNADFLQMAARIDLPGEAEPVLLSMEQTGPRRYEARFPLTNEGRYQIAVTGTAGDRRDSVFAGFVVPYSQEYLRFRSSPIVLEEIASRTGGRILDGTETSEQLFNIERETRQSSRSIADWFLIILACLVPLDVAMRRVQIDWSVVASMLGLSRRRTQSDDTMASLLKRKEQVSSQMQRPEVARGPMLGEMQIEQRWAPKTADADKRRDQRQQEKQKAAEGDDGSTTGALLAARRKRQVDKDETDGTKPS
jgi:uncharacterized membrane protein